MSKTFADYFDKLTFAEQVALAALENRQRIPTTDDPYEVIRKMQLNMVKFALTKVESVVYHLKQDTSFGEGTCRCYACHHAHTLKRVLLDEG